MNFFLPSPGPGRGGATILQRVENSMSVAIPPLAKAPIRAHGGNYHREEVPMPRRAAADLAVTPIGQIDRPPPPASLSPAAGEVWRVVISCMKPGWIGPEAHKLLERYCFAQSEAAKLEGELIQMPMTDPLRAGIVKQYREMCALALSYARSLRLPPKGNTPRDCRDNGRHFEGAAPRDRTARRQVQPWEL